VEIVAYDHNQMSNAWYAFQSVVFLWQYIKKYKPSFIPN
jgi:hypothetical protein